MLRFTPWIETRGSDLTVAEAGEASLRMRLSSVEHYLPLAALRADEDLEYIHQLRVSTRRAIGALRLYRELLRKKPARRLRQTLRSIRQAAGRARDLDVLIDREAPGGKKQKRVLKQLKRRREQAQQPVVEIHERLGRDALLARQIEESLSTLRLAPWSETRFQIWAEERLKEAVDNFFAAAPSDPSDLAALHRFRIRGKGLRYELELLGPAFRPDLQKRTAKVMAKLQTRLGDVNDHAVAGALVHEWMTDSKRARSDLAPLRKREKELLRSAVSEFFRWWTPKRAEELRDSLNRAIAGE